MRNRWYLFFYCSLLLAFIPCQVYGQLNIAHLNQGLKTARADTQRVMLYDSIGVYYKDISPDTSIMFARKGLELAQQIKYIYGEAKMRQLLAILDGRTGNMDDAYTECIKAAQLYKKIKSEAGIASAYNQLGANEGKRRNYDTATKYLLYAQRICERTNDSSTLVNVYVNLGNIFADYISLEKGLEYFNTALPYTKNRVISKLLVLNDIGIIYAKQGKIEKALVYFKAILAESDSSVLFVHTRINALINCTEAYTKLGNNDKALEYADMELQLARRYQMYSEEASGLVNRGGIYSSTDTAMALGDLRAALTIAHIINKSELELEAYSAMIDIYQANSDWKNAFTVLDKKDKLNAQTYSVNKAKQIARMQASYELEKSNIKVEELQLVNQKNEVQNKQLLFFAVCITIAFLIIIFYYRYIIMLNRQLRLQQEELKQLNTVKDKLFSVIGHDLRSPVGSIVGLLSIWETDSITEAEKTEIIAHLKSQTRATLDTLDKLLNWGQAQIKGISIFQTQFSPARVVKESLELLAEQALQKSITITDSIPADIQVFADSLQFDFVVRNLLSNAIKFTHANGAIYLSADTNTLNGFIIFMIRDNGVGISAERQKLIFDTMGASTDGTAQEKGTNVGLKLCKEYVISNGGKIWVTSEPGKGSIFYFSVKNTG